MSNICASIGHIRFKSVYEALKQNGIKYEENSSNSVLVWHDSLKDIDYFTDLKPWQVVNRIPNANVLCRKAPFTRLIQVISIYFPTFYTFYPRSFILPFKNTDFLRSIAKNKHRYIIKPDSGSLGQGIVIVEPGEHYSPDDSLAVAQRYIESFLIDDIKFDLRVYVLLTSISPLEIYIYRDGIARFCSEKIGGSSIYSQITNVTLNKSNSEIEHIEEISKLISDIFPILKNRYNINIEELWSKIDNIIILSIIAAHNYLKQGEENQCPKIGYSRCFQIFGFDILLDNNLDPYVLEINYRPSLDYHRGKERRMKVNMIAESIKIAAPLNQEQSMIHARKWGWDDDSWISFIKNSFELKTQRLNIQENNLQQSNFIKVFPTNGFKQREYEQILSKVDTLPMDFLPGFKHPSRNIKNDE